MSGKSSTQRRRGAEFGTHEDAGVMLIAAERERQILSEGLSFQHDDRHRKGELAMAGACYALLGWYHSCPLKQARASEMYPPKFNPLIWPWADEWWKPKDDPIRNLARAGALIAAEIDRLIRLKKLPVSAPSAVEKGGAK